jgi:hypothetical protein
MNNACSRTPTPLSDYAIADTGTTGHYLLPQSPHVNNNIAKNPITVQMPNGSGITSSHTCDLDVATLPPAARDGHILPGLASHSLLSMAKLCDNGCTVLFDSNRCRVQHKQQTIMEGPRDPTTKLWLLPLCPNPRPVLTTSSTANPHFGNAAQQTSTKSDLIQYLHAACFSPSPTTWTNAIANNQFTTWPGLTTRAVKRYLPPSLATAKGHLDKNRRNTRSTKCTPTPLATDTDMCPKREEKTHAHFACFGMADNKGQIVYTDLTGAFPVTSNSGNKYLLIIYDYDSNAILCEPMKKRCDSEALRAYEHLYQELIQHGSKPTLNIMDNEASTAIKRAIRDSGAKYQLVEPHNHRVNAAERAIRTFKNHLIAGLASTDPRFPIALWDKLLTQAVLTLNLLRTSRLNPKLSAYAQLYGQFDFNRTPLAPPGIRALVYEDPQTRQSWAPHGKEAWYLGPALEHYRCYQFHIPETRGQRITGTATFFPHHCQMPALNPAEAATHAAQELIHVLRNPQPRSPIQQLAPRHLLALRQLADIFQSAAPSASGTANPPTTSPRVDPVSPPRVDPIAPPRVDPIAPPRVTFAPTTIFATSPTRLTQTPSGAPTYTSQRFAPRVATHRYSTRGTSSRLRSGSHFAGAASEQLRTPDRIDQSQRLRNPSLFSGAAVDKLIANSMTPPAYHMNAVIDPVSGKPLRYEDLIRNPKTKALWSHAMTKELARLSQGLKDVTEGTNTVFYLTHEEIKNIPVDRTVTYSRIVTDYRPQKTDPNRVRITVGGNLIDYPGEVTTRTADMITSKILWNSVLSTPGAKYCCADVKNFYLETPMARYEYMRMAARLIPDEFLDAYNLRPKIHNGYIYMEIRKGMYGLPQAGIIANQLLRKRLRPHGYFEVPNTPGLWKHETRPTVFTLVVDDFGIKYTGDKHAQHLIDTLEKYYTVETDWTGGLYCGIQLHWNYINERYLDVQMPAYVPDKLHEFGHKRPKRPQHAPYPAPEPRFGQAAQEPAPTDTTPTLDANGKLRIQKVVGSFLWYGRACDITILKALNSLSRQQSKPTQATAKRTDHLLDYLATHPNASIRYYASDMILNIHSDASYFNEPDGRSTAGGHYFLGRLPRDNQPITLNGAIYTLCTVLKHIAASAAEAELGALFLNVQEAKIIRLILEEMGHPQPPTPIHSDNSTAVGIANNTVKRQRSRAMEMRYFWIVDQVTNKHVRIFWHPGAENLGDYVTKHHSPKHHQQVRPYYTHQSDSKRQLARAQTPSVLRGCVNPAPGTRQSRTGTQQSRIQSRILPTRVRSQHAPQDTYRPALNPVSYHHLLSNHKLVRT